MTPAEIDNMLRPLLLKDLRVQLRARGLSPAGSIEPLRQRLKEHMLSSGDFALKADDGSDMATVEVVAGLTSADQAGGKLQNNYQRAAGQNVGNFLTDRPSSRVLAAPGGGSQIVLGDYEDPALKNSNPARGNNYSRPEGQNVGNFLSDRPSSRVTNAPGGNSQIIFG